MHFLLATLFLECNLQWIKCFKEDCSLTQILIDIVWELTMNRFQLTALIDLRLLTVKETDQWESIKTEALLLIINLILSDLITQIPLDSMKELHYLHIELQDLLQGIDLITLIAISLSLAHYSEKFAAIHRKRILLKQLPDLWKESQDISYKELLKIFINLTLIMEMVLPKSLDSQ